MKKLTYLFLLAGIVMLVSSCQKPSEKAAGSYNGNYTTAFGTDPGTCNIITSGDNVNMTLTAPNQGISSTANGVTASTSGDNVSFSYSFVSTTDGDITAISGTLTGNSLSFSFTIRLGGFAVSGTYAGSK